tara:strand:- start:626 stop:850 length:225 start_codon:yes stop_codon:yes gene_type:complete
VKVGDLVRHNGGGGEGAAIGIIIGKHPEYGWWKVHELCGEYVGVTAEARVLDGGWFVISESSLTDDDRRDTLQG